MKILILSDNHSKTNNINRIINIFHSNVDYIIHCGDSLLSQNQINPLINYIVQGNNDDNSFPFDVNFSANNKKILLTHGHLYFSFGYHVNYEKLSKQFKNVYDIFIFGHLHIPISKMHNKILFICPGSTDYGRNTAGNTFCILEIKANEYLINFYNANNQNLITTKKYLN